MQYTLVNHEGTEFLTVYVPGRAPLMATSESHPEVFDRLVQGARDDDDSIVDLFDRAEAAARKFHALSERVAVRGGAIFLDGDEIDNALTQHVLRFLDEGVDDWKPLVAFFEKVQDNPIEHSREQLFKFLKHNAKAVSITDDGDLVAYKGMRRFTDEDGEVFYQPTSHGHVIIDGMDFASSDDPEAKQYVGSVVEMPRSEVVHDPGQHCSAGLHCATFNYARGFGSAIVEIRVNPRDVGSVPNDSSEKVRACRYRIVGEVDAPHLSPLVVDEEPAAAILTPSEECAQGIALPVVPEAADGVYGPVVDRVDYTVEPDADEPESFAHVVEAADEVELSGVGLLVWAVDEGDPEREAERAEAEAHNAAVMADNDEDEGLSELEDPPLAFDSDDPADTPKHVTEGLSALFAKAQVDHPTEAEFAKMVKRAKTRRRNLTKYATKHGPWTLIGDDPKDRLSWAK